jgi:hypothetical protein
MEGFDKQFGLTVAVIVVLVVLLIVSAVGISKTKDFELDTKGVVGTNYGGAAGEDLSGRFHGGVLIEDNSEAGYKKFKDTLESIRYVVMIGAALLVILFALIAAMFALGDKAAHKWPMVALFVSLAIAAAVWGSILACRVKYIYDSDNNVVSPATTGADAVGATRVVNVALLNTVHYSFVMQLLLSLVAAVCVGATLAISRYGSSAKAATESVKGGMTSAIAKAVSRSESVIGGARAPFWHPTRQ